MKLKARGTYLAAKFINLEISSARYIYLHLEISPARNIYLQIYIFSQRYISPARDIYLQLEICIYIQLERDIDLQLEIDIQTVSKNLILQSIIFVLNFQWLKMSNCRYSLSSYVFFQQSKETKGYRYISSCKNYPTRDISSKRYISLARGRHIFPARQLYISRQRQTFGLYPKI